MPLAICSGVTQRLSSTTLASLTMTEKNARSVSCGSKTSKQWLSVRQPLWDSICPLAVGTVLTDMLVRPGECERPRYQWRASVIDQAWAHDFATEWIAAWNSHDLDRILSHYVEDFEMSSPLIIERKIDPSGVLRGKAAIRAY